MNDHLHTSDARQNSRIERAKQEKTAAAAESDGFELEDGFYRLSSGAPDEKPSIRLIDKSRNRCVLENYNACGRDFIELLIDKNGTVYKIRFNLYNLRLKSAD